MVGHVLVLMPLLYRREQSSDSVTGKCEFEDTVDYILKQLKRKSQMSIIAHAFNLRTQEARGQDRFTKQILASWGY